MPAHRILHHEKMPLRFIISPSQASSKKAVIEQQGKIRTTIKLEGVQQGKDGREWLPFTLRMYFYAGNEQIKMVHSFIYDGDQNKDFIRSLGVRFQVPMREDLYNRHVAFACADGGVWSEPVKPLVGRKNSDTRQRPKLAKATDGRQTKSLNTNVLMQKTEV